MPCKCPLGRSKVQHKGRGKRYLTEEEIRVAEERKTREKEWKVSPNGHVGKFDSFQTAKKRYRSGIRRG